MRITRVLPAIAALSGLLLSVVGAGAPASATDAGDTLLAGHRLTAGTSANHLTSPSGEFRLSVFSADLILDQTTAFNGPDGGSYQTDVWFRDDRTGRHNPAHDHSVLLLKQDGNLVLRLADSTRLWASGTSGSGATRLRLTDGGNLVLLTATGKQVWSSGSGREALVAGDTLGSGRRLVDAWPTGWGPGWHRQFLTMQKDGNLVYTCGAKVLWQTRTHAAGSVLEVGLRGSLRVRSPQGTVVWSSHSASHTPESALSVGQLEYLQLQPTGTTIWQPKLSTSCN